MVKLAQPKADDVMDAAIAQVQTPERVEIEDMPLNTLRDYRLYNEAARAANKKAKLLRYPIKQCPVELHPKQRVKFSVNNGSMQPIPVFLSNHLIHFDEKLTPGKEYDLPECIISYLADKGDTQWGVVTLPDGSTDTRVIGKKPRFSLTTVWRDQ